MSETESQPKNIQKNSENGTSINECDKAGKKVGFIKANGYKTTFFVVLVSSERIKPLKNRKYVLIY